VDDEEKGEFVEVDPIILEELQRSAFISSKPCIRLLPFHCREARQRRVPLAKED